MKRDDLDLRLVAGVEMIGRTGSTGFEMRWSGGPDDDTCGDLVVWTAVATFSKDRAEAAASLDPVEAVMRLCEQLVDGGQCTHCRRPTSFLPDLDYDPSLLEALTCVTAWDPELKTFRRGCEGEAR